MPPPGLYTSLSPQLLPTRAGWVAGLNSVIAGRNLTCLLSSLSLASLVFFPHPKYLVEIENPFGRGGEIMLHIVISHLYLRVNVFKKQVLIMKLNKENLKVLAFNIRKKEGYNCASRKPGLLKCVHHLCLFHPFV